MSYLDMYADVYAMSDIMLMCMSYKKYYPSTGSIQNQTFQKYHKSV